MILYLSERVNCIRITLNSYPKNKNFYCKLIIIYTISSTFMKIIPLLLIFAIMILGDCSPPMPTPKAEKGVLDLREWEFSESGLGAILKLEGEWEFYWEEFLSLEEIEANDLCLAGDNTEKCKSKAYIRFPSTWNGQEFKNKEKSSGYGYATYRLKLLTNTDSTLSVHTGTTNTSYKLFIDKDLILESGKIGSSEETYKPGRKKQIGILKRENSQNIILQVSNFESKYGGPWGTFYLGEYKNIISNRDKNLFLDLFVSGAIFIIGIYHLGLYYKRKKDSTTLWFGLFCQVIFIRGLLTGEHFLHSQGEDLFYLLIRIEYIFIPLGLISLSRFFSSLFSQLQKDRFITLFIYINITLITINLLTPLKIYSQLIEINQILAILLSLYIIIKLIIFIKQKIEFAKTFLFGTLFVVVSNINDILYSNEIVSTGFYFPIGLLFFIIFQSYFLSTKYSSAYSKSENLAEDLKSLAETLEQKVIERTNELNIEKQKSELSSEKTKKLNQMMEVIIQSKGTTDLLNNFDTLLSNNYNINSFTVYVVNEKTNQLDLFDSIFNNSIIGEDIINQFKSISIPLDSSISIHSLCIKKNKTFLTNKPIWLDKMCKEESEINILLEMRSTYIIPLNYEGKCYGTITFADNKYTKSNLINLTKEQRHELENFVKLISPSIYQAIQKTKIEKAFRDLQETQSQLIEAERMASLGQLVGGVAHEINNPIGVIRSNSELIAGNLSSMLDRVPKFLESLSEKEKEVFYSLLNLSIENKIPMTSKEERGRKKEIKKELENTLSNHLERIDFLAEQILLLQLKSPFTYYVDTFGEAKFIESLSIAQIFANQSNSINNIEIAVEKASRVVFALRSYLNTELYLDKKEVDLVSEFEKAVHLYDNYIMGKINVYKDFPNELKYNCTPENLSQVWRHIIFNSIQAMYLTDKKLEVRIEKVPLLPERLKNMQTSLLLEEINNKEFHDTSWIIISITDSGHGITEHLQEKIFTPFFTTKPLGEGIGLGLYVSKKIVHEHGGRIYFESKEGRTEFCVVLPELK